MEVAILYSSRNSFRLEIIDNPLFQEIEPESQSFIHQGTVSDPEPLFKQGHLDVLSQSFIHQGTVSDPCRRPWAYLSPWPSSQSFIHQGTVSDTEFENKGATQETCVAILYSSRNSFRPHTLFLLKLLYLFTLFVSRAKISGMHTHSR